MLSKKKFVGVFFISFFVLQLSALFADSAKVLCDFEKLQKDAELAEYFNPDGELDLKEGFLSFSALDNFNPERGCVEFEFSPYWTGDAQKRHEITLFCCRSGSGNLFTIYMRGVDLYVSYSVAGTRNVYLYQGIGVVKESEWYKVQVNYDSRNKIKDGTKLSAGTVIINNKNGFQLGASARFKPMQIDNKSTLSFGRQNGKYISRFNAKIRNFRLYSSCKDVELLDPPSFKPEMDKYSIFSDVSSTYVREFSPHQSNDDSPVHFDFSYGNSRILTLPQKRHIELLKISIRNPDVKNYPLADSFGIYAGDNETWYSNVPIQAVKEVQDDEQVHIWYKISAKTRFVKIYNQDSSVKISLPEVFLYEKKISDKRQSGFIIAEKENLQIWQENSLQKVLRNSPLPEKYSNLVELSAAKGEIESFQIIAKAETDRQGILSVEFSDLRMGFRSISKNNITINRQGYINIENPSPFSEAAEWPDPLMPESEVELMAGNNPLWINLKVPRDAAKGLYQASFKVKIDAEIIAEGRLNLKVYNFTLPEKPSFQSITVFRKQHPDKYCPEVTREDCYKLFSRNRLGGVVSGLPIKLDITEEEALIDTSEFEKQSGFYFDECNFNIFGLPHVYLGEQGHLYKWKNFEPMSDDYKKYLGSYLQKVDKYLSSKNLADKTVLYLADEIWGGKYDMFSETYHFVKQNAPNLRTLLTVAPWHGGLLKAVDIWCKSSVVDPESKRNIRKHGSTAFTYWNSTYATDKPAMRHRAVAWACDSNDIKGYLFWGICAWGRGNPFDEPAIFIRDNVMQSWSPGNGWLIYPSPDGKEILSSIRFEMFRDSFEDYDYLTLLRNVLEKNIPMKVFREGQTLLKKAHLLVPKITEYPEAEELLAIRNEIGNFLDKHSRYIK